MAGNSFGNLFKISTFGESHGIAIGVLIDGCPAGIPIETVDIQTVLNKRKPGQSHITTTRAESDEVEILSGIFEGKTLGTPIALLIKNKDAQSNDYAHLKNSYRPSHADFTYEKKFGLRDYRGGGRASARETAARVAAGAVALKLLQQLNIKTTAYVSSVYKTALTANWQNLDFNNIEKTIVRCPDLVVAQQMIQEIEKAKDEGNSLGGTITCVVQNVPVGLGEPVFDKLDAQLAKAMLSIPAVKGFEIGSGFGGTQMKGTEHNDVFYSENEKIITKSNFSGGVQGGISNGMPIYFKVAFKPTATIMQTQESVDKDGKQIMLESKGRHDPCVLPRAVPIVEAMTNLVLADFLLLAKTNTL